MHWMAQHWLALALLIGYTGALLYNAYLGSQASRGMAGYYVGNREMSGIVVGISFFATFASTNTYIGHAGKAYDYGVAWFTMAILWSPCPSSVLTSRPDRIHDTDRWMA